MIWAGSRQPKPVLRVGSRTTEYKLGVGVGTELRDGVPAYHVQGPELDNTVINKLRKWLVRV